MHPDNELPINPYAGRNFYRTHFKIAPGPNRRETAAYCAAGTFLENNPNAALRTPITDAMRVAHGMAPAQPESRKARRRRERSRK